MQHAIPYFHSKITKSARKGSKSSTFCLFQNTLLVTKLTQYDMPHFHIFNPKYPKNAQKRLFNFFTPKNSFSDQITPINDMQHDITHFHIFLPK